MKSVLAVFLCSAGLSAQQASIEGTTLHSLTHEPIPGVHVRLLSASYGGITAAYGAISDRNGHFSMATVRPGAYLLDPERSGFLYYSTRGASAAVPNITLRPGQQLTGFKIELTPRAILSGKVVDENGDPVQGVNLQATPVDEKDQAIFLRRPPDFPTNDRGEFRLTTAPGRYYLQARAQVFNRGGNEKPELRDGSALAPYRVTFYPSSTAKGRATPVDAVGGKETAGLEIRLSRQPGVVVTGIVRGAPDSSASGARPSVIAQWGPTPQSANSSNSTSTDSEGRFTLQDAQAGFYRIYAFWYVKPQMISRAVEIQVGNNDVTNLELTLLAGTEISGKVEFEGDAPGSPITLRAVRLDRAEGFVPMQPGGGEIDAKGAFTLTGVGSGKYLVELTPLPENAYLKRLVIDGAESPGNLADFTAAPGRATMRITLARDGARIDGRLLEENGDRMLSSFGMVVLSAVPIPDSINQYRIERVQPDGVFSIKGLRPGKYRIVAFDALRNVGLPDAMRKLLEKGEEFELAPNARLEKNVRMQPREDGDAKPKQ